MSKKRTLVGLRESGVLFTPIFIMVLTLLLISLLISCGAPATTTKTQPTTVIATTTQATTSTAPVTTTAAAAKPQGELVVGLQNFGNENFLPWLDAWMSNLDNLVYDMLIYWDHVKSKIFPGACRKLGSLTGWYEYHLSLEERNPVPGRLGRTNFSGCKV